VAFRAPMTVDSLRDRHDREIREYRDALRSIRLSLYRKQEEVISERRCDEEILTTVHRQLGETG
jgi:hypothetical protein